MDPVDVARLEWRSARCDNASCVEVAVTAHGAGMRDGKDPDGPVLWFEVAQWAAFVEGIREGEFTPE